MNLNKQIFHFAYNELVEYFGLSKRKRDMIMWGRSSWNRLSNQVMESIIQWRCLSNKRSVSCGEKGLPEWEQFKPYVIAINMK